MQHLHCRPSPRVDSACLKPGGKWLSDTPRLAAINSFGFGGNNAHLLIQEETSELVVASADAERERSTFAIVSLAVRTDQDPDADAFGRRVCGNGTSQLDRNRIQLSARSLAFPPADLKQALGQQLILLELLPHITKGFEATEK